MRRRDTLPGLILAVALLLWVSSSASGRMYQYRDSTGVVHFTDSLSRIPPDLLPRVEPLGPALPGPAPQGGPEGTDAEKISPSDGDAGAGSGVNADQEDEPPILKRLNRERAALLREHKSLKREKAALGREKAGLETPEEVRAYGKRVKALNRRIEAYKERNKAYAREVDAYNRALEEDKE